MEASEAHNLVSKDPAGSSPASATKAFFENITLLEASKYIPLKPKVNPLWKHETKEKTLRGKV